MENLIVFAVDLPKTQPPQAEILKEIISDKLTTAIREIIIAVETTILGYDKEILLLKRELEDYKIQLSAAMQPKVSLSTKEENNDDYFDYGKDVAKPTPMQEGGADEDIPYHSTTVPSLVNTHPPKDEKFSDAVQAGSGSDQLWSETPVFPINQTTEAYFPDSYQRLDPKPIQVVKTEPMDEQIDCVSESETQITDVLGCKICGASFSSKPFLIEHFLHHHLDSPTEDRCMCGVCGQHLESTEDLKAHLKSHIELLHCENFQKDIAACQSGQGVPAGGPLPKKYFQCNHCPQSFKYKSQLQIHYRKHTGVKPFFCEICGKSLTTLEDYADHKQSHKPSVKCPLCDKTPKNMVQHMRVHSGEKPFTCTECGMKFYKQSLLKSHMNVHLGVKPFSCTECDYKCSRKEHLVVHMRTHTGQKPYRCEVCGQGFTQNHNLKSHMKRHLTTTGLCDKTEV